MAAGHIKYDRLLVSQSGLLSEIFDVAEQTWSCCMVSDEVHPTRREKVEELQLNFLRSLRRFCRAPILMTRHVSHDTTFTGTFKVRSVKSHHCQLRRVLLLLSILVENRSYGGRCRTNNAGLECRLSARRLPQLSRVRLDWHVHARFMSPDFSSGAEARGGGENAERAVVENDITRKR